MSGKLSRQVLLKSTTIAGTLFTGLSYGAVHAAGDDILKVALIGCGGRGRGAAVNTLSADPNVKLVAVADAFLPAAEAAAEGLKAQFEDRVDLNDGIFAGLDAYKAAIDRADVVLLCTPPGFRPQMLRYAIEKGKHVFAEKPVAVDAPGVRDVLESAAMAKEKGLTLVSGLCWRYETKDREIMERVLDGAIGRVTSGRVTYLTGGLWARPRQEGDTELMAQVRNWYNHTWLSGDFDVEQHVHTLDHIAWAMGGAMPATCYGLGSRMQRVAQPESGDIYDSMSAVFEYPNGETFYSFCRQQNGCWNENAAYIFGTKGRAKTLWGGGAIYDLSGNVIFQQEGGISDMYTLEHEAMYKSIRGEIDTINNGESMAKSTMLGIWQRETCYTGEKTTWDAALNSDKSYAPSEYA
ncbi:MAG: Gfo/Idh/MocA family oxidoreductase [Thermoguttaceae bacterium]|nr:Gfo/Idh/MocA family oxidoreductase [Thermoguttaceae bacterium]